MVTAEIKLLEVMAKNNIRTIKEISEKSGLSRKAISKILSGRQAALRLETISSLCEALDCSVGDLIVLKNKGV